MHTSHQMPACESSPSAEIFIGFGAQPVPPSLETEKYHNLAEVSYAASGAVLTALAQQKYQRRLNLEVRSFMSYVYGHSEDWTQG